MIVLWWFNCHQLWLHISTGMLVLTVLGRVDEQNRNLQRQCLHLETLTISEVANCFVTLKVVNYLGQLTSMGCRQMEGKCDMGVSWISNNSYFILLCLVFAFFFSPCRYWSDNNIAVHLVGSCAVSIHHAQCLLHGEDTATAPRGEVRQHCYRPHCNMDDDREVCMWLNGVDFTMKILLKSTPTSAQPLIFTCNPRSLETVQVLLPTYLFQRSRLKIEQLRTKTPATWLFKNK